LVTGAAGGSRIITATLQSIWNIIDRNMTMYDALAEPRLHDQLNPPTTALEKGFDRGGEESLRAKGHNITIVDLGFSAVHAVGWKVDGSWEAVGEPRQKNSGGAVV
jgi:gamma-glutamyltranspeptidase/glutathione hydrolase